MRYKTVLRALFPTGSYSFKIRFYNNQMKVNISNVTDLHLFIFKYIYIYLFTFIRFLNTAEIKMDIVTFFNKCNDLFPCYEIANITKIVFIILVLINWWKKRNYENYIYWARQNYVVRCSAYRQAMFVGKKVNNLNVLNVRRYI